MTPSSANAPPAHFNEAVVVLFASLDGDGDTKLTQEERQLSSDIYLSDLFKDLLFCCFQVLGPFQSALVGILSNFPIEIVQMVRYELKLI